MSPSRGKKSNRHPADSGTWPVPAGCEDSMNKWGKLRVKYNQISCVFIPSSSLASGRRICLLKTCSILNQLIIFSSFELSHQFSSHSLPYRRKKRREVRKKRDITFTLCFMTALQKYLDMIACNSDNKNKGQPGDVAK